MQVSVQGLGECPLLSESRREGGAQPWVRATGLRPGGREEGRIPRKRRGGRLNGPLLVLKKNSPVRLTVLKKKRGRARFVIPHPKLHRRNVCQEVYVDHGNSSYCCVQFQVGNKHQHLFTSCDVLRRRQLLGHEDNECGASQLRATLLHRRSLLDFGCMPVGGACKLTSEAMTRSLCTTQPRT